MEKYVINCNRTIGEVQYAETLQDLLGNLQTFRRKNWTCIQYKDIYNQTICVTRANINNGMSIQDSIDDWLGWAESSLLAEPILAIEDGALTMIK